MTILIDIPPELESQLRRAAAQAGLAPDAYIIQTLHEQLTPQQSSPADVIEALGLKPVTHG